jgi:drug/metabolite transporter (DMT)-like permease
MNVNLNFLQTIGDRKMIVIITLMLIISLCLVFGQVFLKFAFNESAYKLNVNTLFSLKILSLLFSKFFIASIFFFIVGVCLWFYVISQNIELSVVYPLISFSYIIMALLASFFLKEELTFQKISGIIIICIGITILTWGYKFPLR